VRISFDAAGNKVLRNFEKLLSAEKRHFYETLNLIKKNEKWSGSGTKEFARFPEQHENNHQSRDIKMWPKLRAGAQMDKSKSENFWYATRAGEIFTKIKIVKKYLEAYFWRGTIGELCQQCRKMTYPIQAFQVRFWVQFWVRFESDLTLLVIFLKVIISPVKKAVFRHCFVVCFEKLNRLFLK
jgi:hypothetical protein